MSQHYNDRMLSAREDKATRPDVAPQAKGTVTRWTDRGYGFIKPDAGGRDVFCHVSRLQGGLTELRTGDRVSYELGTHSRTGQPEAQNVALID